MTTTPPSERQLDEYEAAARNAARIGSGIDPAAVLELAAEVRRQHAELAELERPAVEAKRNEIRQSFAELAAAARETGDHEGAAEVECRLRDREEQWKREDATATHAPSRSSGAAVSAPQPTGDPRATPDTPNAPHGCTGSSVAARREQ